VRPYQGRRWLVCDPDFRGRRVTQWWRAEVDPAPKAVRYTMLFFHDEAVGFAAGHRPCSECRHARYAAYRDAWALAHDGGRPTADDIDRRLHQERLDGRRPRWHPADWADLPDGTFVLLAGAGPALVWEGALVLWTVEGYGAPVPRPSRGRAVVLTPPATVAVLRAGYRPAVDVGTGVTTERRGKGGQGSRRGERLPRQPV
jgi:hypothetical protein